MPPKGSKIGPPPIPAANPDHPSALQQQEHLEGISEYELPKTTLMKLAKGSIPGDVKIQQEIIMALLRSSTLFINYLTSCGNKLTTSAHDQALARSGKSITAGDVLKAITDLDFGPADELVPLLEQELAAFRANQQASKLNKTKAAAASRGKPRQSNVTVQETGDEQEEEDEEDEGGLADQSALMDED